MSKAVAIDILFFLFSALILVVGEIIDEFSNTRVGGIISTIFKVIGWCGLGIILLLEVIGLIGFAVGVLV